MALTSVRERRERERTHQPADRSQSSHGTRRENPHGRRSRAARRRDRDGGNTRTRFSDDENAGELKRDGTGRTTGGGGASKRGVVFTSPVEPFRRLNSARARFFFQRRIGALERLVGAPERRRHQRRRPTTRVLVRVAGFPTGRATASNGGRPTPAEIRRPFFARSIAKLTNSRRAARTSHDVPALLP